MCAVFSVPPIVIKLIENIGKYVDYNCLFVSVKCHLKGDFPLEENLSSCEEIGQT